MDRYTLYGLTNCDSCRNARKWLDARQIDYEFIDVRDDGVPAERLASWCRDDGWKSLVNTRSRTWREIPEQDRQALSETKALRLLTTYPLLMKRPVLQDASNAPLIGFSPASYANACS